MLLCAASADVVLERGVVSTQPSARMPAVGTVHGGGWDARDRSDMDGVARHLDGHGAGHIVTFLFGLGAEAGIDLLGAVLSPAGNA